MGSCYSAQCKKRIWLLIVFFALFSLLYVRAHYHCPFQRVEVAQADLATVTDVVLLQKRPLVIVDRILRHLDLVKLSAFRLLHVKASAPRAYKHVDGLPHLIATARFTLVYQSHSDITHVEIRHPNTGAGAIIVLRRHQTLILPPRWRYICPDGATVHELHDCVSLALSSLGLTRSGAQTLQTKWGTP